MKKSPVKENVSLKINSIRDDSIVIDLTEDSLSENISDESFNSLEQRDWQAAVQETLQHSVLENNVNVEQSINVDENDILAIEVNKTQEIVYVKPSIHFAVNLETNIHCIRIVYLGKIF